MRIYRNVARFVSFFVIVLFFSSCADRSLVRVADPPATPVLSRNLGWAVVKSSYAQVFDIPSASGVVLGYYRKAVVVPVTERKRQSSDGGEPISWLRNEGEEPGWIRESDVLVFDSPEKARTAAGTVGP